MLVINIPEVGDCLPIEELDGEYYMLHILGHILTKSGRTVRVDLEIYSNYITIGCIKYKCIPIRKITNTEKLAGAVILSKKDVEKIYKYLKEIVEVI